MSESLVRGAFKIAVGFVVITLILLAGTLYMSKYYLAQQQQFAAAGDVPAALESTRLAARLSPFDSDPLVAESNLLSVQGDNQGALRALKEATRRDPANNVNYGTLGNFYLNQMEDPKAAVGAYREALKRIPKATNIQGFLATALAQSGDLDGAKREYEELADVDRITLQDRYTLGKIYARTSEPDKALETLQQAKEKAEKRRDQAKGPKKARMETFVQSVDLATADVYVAQQDYEGAIGVLEKSKSPQAPAIIELLKTDPELYRQQVLESEI